MKKKHLCLLSPILICFFFSCQDMLNSKFNLGTVYGTHNAISWKYDVTEGKMTVYGTSTPSDPFTATSLTDVHTERIKTLILYVHPLILGDYAFSDFRNVVEIHIENGVGWAGKEILQGLDWLDDFRINGPVNPEQWNDLWACGYDNCGWMLYRNASGKTCLCVFGTGSTDTVFSIDKPWLYQPFTNIFVTYGITGIRSYLFADYGGITTVSLPATVTYVGEYAFRGEAGAVITLGWTASDQTFRDLPGLSWPQTDATVIYSDGTIYIK